MITTAFRIAYKSRKPIKDIARHSVLITYILRNLTALKEEIDVARTTEAFPTSVEPVEEHSVTDEYVKVKNLTEANPEILFEEKEAATEKLAVSDYGGKLSHDPDIEKKNAAVDINDERVTKEGNQRELEEQYEDGYDIFFWSI